MPLAPALFSITMPTPSAVPSSLRDQARRGVGAAAGRERQHQRDVAVRIIGACAGAAAASASIRAAARDGAQYR